jgi:hypothetical protein
LVGLVSAILTLGAFPLWAQSDKELARARQLYNQGLTQEAAGDWAGALATFEDVAKLKMSPQVRFHIARSKEHLGRLNEALGGYRLAEYEASQLGDKAQDLLREVQSAREALEKRVPKLVIDRGEGAAAAKIELDGVALGASQIGSEINTDPGPHQVVGVLPGGRRFTQTVELGEGETKHVRLDLPAAAAAEPTAEPPTTPQADEPASSDTTAAVTTDSGSALPWVIGGIGVASLAASAVFYTLKNNAEDELESGCLGRTCPDTLEDTQSKGETYATLTGVTLGVGVVGVGVAVVMLLTNRSSGPERADRAVRIGVLPGSRSARLDLALSF